MAEEIVNRVAKSKLVTIDLEDFYPKGKRVHFDISQWLAEGIVLREKDFRNAVASHDWQEYKDAYVALYCKTDAIIPGWAYLLITLQLAPYAKKVIVGSLEDLETVLFTEFLNDFDVSEYENKPIIITGCTHKPIPETAYTLLAQKLFPVVRSVMYGEACSSVPLFKRSLR